MKSAEIARLHQLQIVIDTGDDAALAAHVRSRKAARLLTALMPVAIALILLAATAFAAVLVGGPQASPYMDAIGAPSPDPEISIPTRPEAIDSRALGHRKAGATAQRSGEPASAGRGSRRHRATVSLLEHADRAAANHSVPFHILAGLAEDESSWRPGVAGKNGELGLMQLKRPVARWCGIKDRRDPGQNLDCGARYLAAQFATFGTWELAVVAFKAGPARIPENIPADSWAFAQRALQRAEAYR